MVTATPENLAALLERLSGQRGGPEAETLLVASKLTPGAILVSSSRGSNIAAILRRNPAAVRRYREVGDEVTLEMDDDAFRGVEYAFSLGAEQSTPMSDEARARFRALSEVA